MDGGTILGVTLAALLWLPATHALRAPAWSASLIAVVSIGGFSWTGQVLWAAPIAAIVCVYAEKWLFSSVLRVQVFAVTLMVLSLAALPQLAPLTVGFALGVFYDRSLTNSLLLYRAAALTLLVLIVAMHPGFWGQAPEAHSLVQDYLAPAMGMILFAIATQIGSGVLKRAREAGKDRLFIVAEREIAGLMGRLTQRDSQPA